MMFNDGFCDLCHEFKGHENLMGAVCPIGKFLACDECRERIERFESDLERGKFIADGLEGKDG